MDDQDERARAGLLFDTAWPGYRPMKARAHDLCRRYNALDELDGARGEVLAQIFASLGEGAHVRGPLHVNCGVHTRIGARFFANFNLTILDDVPVTIGDDVQLGPGVTIVAGTHPLLFEERTRLTYPDGHVGGAEYGDPVTIGDGVWLGAGVTVLPGVTIGERAGYHFVGLRLRSCFNRADWMQEQMGGIENRREIGRASCRERV